MQATIIGAVRCLMGQGDRFDGYAEDESAMRSGCEMTAIYHFLCNETEFSLRSFAIIHYLCRLVIETQARCSYDWPMCSSHYA